MDEIGPAATLSILVKAQGVQATAGQLKGLDAAGRNAGKGMGVAESSAKRSSKTFSALGVAAKSAGVLVGAAGLAAGVKSAVSEFREAQKTGAQTTAVLKSTGGAAKVSTKQIQDLANAISKKSGIDDEAIQSGENLLLTFTKLRNETGKGNDIFNQATQIITDMSVSLKQGLKPSAIQVGKALNDPIKGITALRRVGVAFTAEQEKQIKTLVKSGDLLGAQKMVLKELRTEFAGSAAAQATAGDKFKVSLNNLAEAAGAVLVPQIDKVAKTLTTLMNQMTQGTGVGGALVSTFRTTGTVIGTVVGAINSLVNGFKDGNAGAVLLGTAVIALTAGFTTYKAIMIATTTATKAMTAAQFGLNLAMSVNPVILTIAALVALGVALVVLYTKVEKFRNAVDNTFNWIKNNWPLLLGILTGPIGLAVVVITKNWDKIRSTFTGALASLKNAMSSAGGSLAAAAGTMAKALIGGFKSALNLAHELAVAMRDLISKAPGYALGVGKAIVSGIINGIKGAAGGIGNALKGAVKGASPDFLGVGDGIGKSIGAGSIVPVKGGGSLMGARPIMSRFAAVGAANGLSVSSGLRPGAVTSSGNSSWHGTGEAIDMSGPPAGMLKTFKALRSKFGSKLAELIHTPGGAGIKNGQPYVYTGQVAADHFDHVHVAFDSGKPGQGDGLGKVGRRKPGTGDGIGVAIAAARKAGFTGEALVRMVAIAGRESNYNPRAANYKPPDHSIGLWQINQLAHHGRFGSDKELMNPDTNAHAAWVLSSGGKNFGPWSTNRGLSAGRIEAARKAIAAGAGGGATAGAGGSAGGGAGGGAAGGSAAAGKVNPYDQSIASADVAIADAGHAIGRFSTGLRTAAALRVKQKIIGSRIRAVRAALKKPNLKPATRLRLTQELAQLLPEHAQLGRDRQAALAGPAPDVSIGGGEDGGDPNQPLIDAINAAAEQAAEDARIRAEADAAHTAAMTVLKDEINKQNAIAGSTVAIGLREAQRALADIVSNQLGVQVGQRGLTAGSGVGVRY